jgi:hypothetical protein
MPKALIYITAGFLFVGVLPLPYGYYMLLRLIACGVFAWAAYIAFERKDDVLPWVFIVLAIVFNPIIKIHFPKEFWVALDIGSAIFILVVKPKITGSRK